MKNILGALVIAATLQAGWASNRVPKVFYGNYEAFEKHYNADGKIESDRVVYVFARFQRSGMRISGRGFSTPSTITLFRNGLMTFRGGNIREQGRWKVTGGVVRIVSNGSSNGTIVRTYRRRGNKVLGEGHAQNGGRYEFSATKIHGRVRGDSAPASTTLTSTVANGL